jgi:hypothetical protein
MPAAMAGQRGFGRVGVPLSPEGTIAKTGVLARALKNWWKPAVRAGLSGSSMPAEPHASGEYAAWIRELGPEEGKRAYTDIRRHQNAKALMMRQLDEDTKAWFGNLSEKQQAQLFEVAKGLRTDHATGATEFGSIQQAGVLRIRGRKAKRAINTDLGVDMTLDEALQGGTLPNGYIIGELLPAQKMIQLYRPITEADARRRYNEVIQAVPHAADILRDYKALEEEVKTEPLYGMRMPPRSVEVMRKEYGIESRRPDEVGYVPSVTKAPRTFVGKIRRALHEARSGHRLIKTGEAAERNLEVQNLAKATEHVRASLIEEEIRHNLAVTLLPLVLKAKPAGETPKNWVEFSRGSLKNPEKVIAWASRNRKRLMDQGVDVDNFISTAAQAGGKRYIMPEYAAQRLGEMIGPKGGSVDPAYENVRKASTDLGNNVVSFMAANYLGRPSTSVRNFVSNRINHSIMTLRDGIAGIAQHVIPAMHYQQLPMSQFVADIVAPFSSIGKGSRSALPPEAMGKLFSADLGHTNLPGLVLRYNGFNADDIWTRRTIYEAVSRGRAANVYEELRNAGEHVPSWPQFYKEFRSALPPEVEHQAWRMNDTFGSFNYENVPRAIEKLKSGPAARAAIMYPTYYYKLLNGPYRELYSPRNYAELFGSGRSPAQRNQALANILTGYIVAGLLWKMIPDPWREYPSGLKEADLPTEAQTVGRIKVPFLRSAKDEAYWVRALDLPFVGDVMALKAMAAGHLEFPSYLNERMNAGPLALLTMWLFDYQGRFDRYTPLATRLGAQLASFAPLSPLWLYTRRLVDPTRRRPAIRGWKGDTAWESFLAGIMDSTPGLSQYLEVAHANVQPHQPLRYPPLPENLKFWLLNVKPIREGQRRAAIQEAERRRQERESKKLLSAWGGR